MNIYTIGFSQKSAEEFFTLLTSNNIKQLIDIRLNNKSQLAGFTNVKHLPYLLNIHNINYKHELQMAPTKDLLDGYKNKTISWNEYEIQYSKILNDRNIISKIDINNIDKSVFLCSEPKANQCHRRLLAEYLKKHFKDIIIRHL